MNVSRWLPIAVSSVVLPWSIGSFAAPKAAPADVDAFVKALPAPGAHDRAFLAVPAALLARLAIAPAALSAIDPGHACASSSGSVTLSQAALGTLGHIEMLCTPDGHGQATIRLENGVSYMTTCGDRASFRLTANLDVHAGDRAWHGSADTAAPASELSHSCTGWTKVPG